MKILANILITLFIILPGLSAITCWWAFVSSSIFELLFGFKDEWRSYEYGVYIGYIIEWIIILLVGYGISKFGYWLIKKNNKQTFPVQKIALSVLVVFFMILPGIFLITSGILLMFTITMITILNIENPSSSGLSGSILSYLSWHGLTVISFIAMIISGYTLIRWGVKLRENIKK